MPIREPAQLAELTAPQLRMHLDEALQIYVTAMHYPPGTARHRSPMWLEHMLRDGWLCMAAFDADALVGIGYGYRGAPGQWWHDEVQRGLMLIDHRRAQRELADYFELTEL
ncbi:MAG: GNAT family N-acetyltransferase, partial [Pseudonocardiaceae bacterium]